MENMCNKSNLIIKNEISETEENEKTVSRSESPVFKCFNHKPTRIIRVDSSDYDIPSYQVNQSAKSKTFSKHESESSESFLPFTPSFSPILPAVQFQPPPIHSLGTVFKSMKQTSNSVIDKQPIQKSENVFENLGMTDKDISWVSSMASPPPQIPGSEFNTIEKATFFPEDKFQNIQPRALFSPTHDDDFGCKPLSFTSESEDDEAYQTNIRLSDVCATLNKLEVKSFEQTHSEITINNSSPSKNEPTSPVIKTRKKKLENSTKKKKQILVNSPLSENNYDFTVGESVNSSSATNSTGSVQNFIEDDSFQSMSFSCLDELCKTLVNSTTSSKSIDCDKTIINECETMENCKKNVKKCFYVTKNKPDVQEVTTKNTFYAYVEALEEGNATTPQSSKTQKSFTNKEILKLDELNMNTKVDSVKRAHSELNKEEEGKLKKQKTEESSVSDWPEESDMCLTQHSISDCEMFKTVEYLEKTLENQNYDKNKVCIVGNKVEHNSVSKTDGVNQSSTSSSNKNFQIRFLTASGSNIPITEEALSRAIDVFDKCMEETEINCDSRVGFSCTSGKKIQISSESLEKAKKMMLDCVEDVNTTTNEKSQEAEDLKTDILWSSTPIKDFSTSDFEENSKINVGFDEKVKTSDTDGVNFSSNRVNSYMPRKFPFDLYNSYRAKVNVSSEKGLTLNEVSEDKSKEPPFPLFGFSTAGGTKLTASKEAIEKAKSLMSKELNEDCEKEDSFIPSNYSTTATGTKGNTSKEALEKPKTFTSEEKDPSFFVGFSTASGTKVNISKESLEKAKSFMAEDEFQTRGIEASTCLNSGLSEVPNFGFTTAAGTKVNVSKEALEKAKAIMSEDDINFIEVDLNERSSKASIKSTIPSMVFTTAGGTKVNVSKEALEKARALMSEDDINLTEVDVNEESSKELSRSTIPPVGFVTAGGAKVNVSEEALQKAKALMCEDDINFTEVDLNERSSKASIKSTIPPMGFTTAGGTKVNVSEEALKKAKALINEDDINFTDVELNKKRSKELVKRKIPPVGFKTAGGTKVNVSEEALEKAKALMLKDDIKLNEGNPNSEGNKTFPLGFSTAGGTKVNVSKEALEKARALMSKDDINLTEVDVNEESSKELSGSPVGFVTAGGTKVNVSKEALGKTRALMSDENIGLTGKNIISPLGFSTASVTKVTASKEALEKAKALMAEDEIRMIDGGRVKSSRRTGVEQEPDYFSEESNTCSVLKEKNNLGFSFKGFSTALGNTVKVSAEALEKARAFMAQDENIKRASTSTGLEQTISNKNAFRSDVSKENLVSEQNTVDTKVDESVPKMTCFDDDWDEIIPSWLHVYSTSPSMVTDRTDLAPMVCDENDKSSTLDGHCIVKSPVLGTHDRFGKKRKRKNLNFDSDNSSDKKPFISSTSTGFDEPFGIKKSSNKRSGDPLCLDFSAPFKRIKSEEGESINVNEERVKARIEQDKIASDKEKVKPVKGSFLIRKKTEKQMKWSEAVKKSYPEIYSDEYLKSVHVKEDIININFTNADSFRFNGLEFFGYECLKNTTGFQVGDGCKLIPNDDNTFGVKEFKKAFLASPGVQPNLIPPGWIENHYKWIVWKLSHYEKSFPQFFAGGCLTPHNVMLQLKYRYDREIDGSERSALKKILERDDTSMKRLVLCVCGVEKVTKDGATDYKLNLTDGWYSCPARGDLAMTKLVESGKIIIGTKLVTQGATLVNCEQGISPLEVNEDVYLKMSTNSTRRARWDTKLGYQKNPENITVSLGSVLPQGGNISRLNVIVVRIYPMLYMEKTADGCHVTRNLRSEERAEAEYQRIQEKRMEAILNEINLEMEKSDKNQKKKLENCENLSQLWDNNSDPSGESMSLSQKQSYQNLVSNRNDRRAREIREKIEQKLKKEKLGKRNVSEFFRVRVVDMRKPDYNNPGTLSIWNPNEEVVRVLGEGKAVAVTNISIGNPLRVCKPIQLNTTRSTQFREINKNVKYPARKLTHLKDVSSKICPVFEEVDLVGVVTKMQEVAYGSRLSQVVYLTDLDFNFVGILFWGNCKNYGWENVFKLYSTVACSNLLWKKNYSVQEVPVLHVNESSVFTENPKHSYLKEELERLESKIPQDKSSFFSKLEEELIVKLEESKWKNNSNRSFAEDSPLCRSRLQGRFESKPTASSTPIKPCSSILPSDEAEPSPIQKRIEKLQSYGEPPPLLPLLITNRTRKMKKKS